MSSKSKTVKLPVAKAEKPGSLDRATLSRVTEEVSQLKPLRNLSRQLVHQSCDDLDGVVAIEEAKVVHLEDMSLSDITLLEECTKLEFCFLQNNFLFKIDALASCHKLQKLDLSSNKIQLLPRAEFWKEFTALQILDLHDNQISSMKSLEGLLSLPNITSMTLYNNPIAEHPQYRPLIVNSLSTLRAFDGYVISDAEVIHGANFGDKYTTKSASFKLEEFQYTPGDYKHHLAQLKDELQNVFQIYFKRSPVVMIQRTLRGLMVRLKLKALRRKRLEAATRIQRRWAKGALSRFLPDNLGESGVQRFGEDFKQLNTNIGIMKLNRAAIQVQRWRREALQRRKGQKEEWAARVLQRSWRRTLNVRIEFRAYLKSNRVRHILFTAHEAETMKKIIRRAREQLEKIDPTRVAKKTTSGSSDDPVLFRYTNHRIIRPAKSWIIGDDGCAIQPGLLVTTSKFNRPVQEIENLHKMRVGVGAREEDIESLHHLPRRANYVGSRTASAYWRQLRKYGTDLVDRAMGSVETRLHVTNPRPDEPNYYMQYYVKNPTLYGLIMQGVAVWNSKLQQKGKDDEDYVRLAPITDHEFNRLAAAISLQSAWRAHKTLMEAQPTLSRRLLMHRAVLTLQSWWRRHLARLRRVFLGRIRDLVKEVDSRDLFIDAQAFEDLNDPSVFKPRTLFPEHNIQFNITTSNITQLIANDFEYTGLPLWPHCRAPTIRGDQLGENIGRMDTYALVSVNTTTDKANELDVPTIDRELLRIRFSSVFEARLRAVLLFIATFDPIAMKSKARLFTTKSLFEWEADSILNPTQTTRSKSKKPRAESAQAKLNEAEKPANFAEAETLLNTLTNEQAAEQVNLLRAKINPDPEVIASKVSEQSDALSLTGMTPYLDIQMPLDKEAQVEDRKWAATQHRRYFDMTLSEQRTKEMKDTLRKKEDRRKATPKLAAQLRSHAKKEYTRQLAQIQKAEAKYNTVRQNHIEEAKKRVALKRQQEKERKETLALKRQFAKRDLRQRARTDRINAMYKVSEVQHRMEEEREERKAKTQRERNMRASSRQEKDFHSTFARHQNLIASQLRSGERIHHKEEQHHQNRQQVSKIRQERSESRARRQQYTLEKLHAARVKAATSKAEIKARIINRSIHEEQEWAARREAIEYQRAKTRAGTHATHDDNGQDDYYGDDSEYGSSTNPYVLRARTATGGSRGGARRTQPESTHSLPPLGPGGDQSLTTRWERIQQSPLSSFSLIDQDFVPGDPSSPRRPGRRPHTQASPRVRQDHWESSHAFSARDTQEVSVTDWDDEYDDMDGTHSNNVHDVTISKTEPRGFHGSARPPMREPKAPVAMKGHGAQSKFLIGNK